MKGYQETVQMVSKVLTILYRKLDKQGLRLYVHSPDGMKNDHRLLDQDCSTADRLSKTLPRLRLWIDQAWPAGWSDGEDVVFGPLTYWQWLTIFKCQQETPALINRLSLSLPAGMRNFIFIIHQKFLSCSAELSRLNLWPFLFSIQRYI